MNTEQRKALNRELKDLHSQRRDWLKPTLANLSHIDYCLLPCNSGGPCLSPSTAVTLDGKTVTVPVCVGCGMEEYRRVRRDEITARVEELKQLRGKPAR
jgi:hypothetical protein